MNYDDASGKTLRDQLMAAYLAHQAHANGSLQLPGAGIPGQGAMPPVPAALPSVPPAAAFPGAPPAVPLPTAAAAPAFPGAPPAGPMPMVGNGNPMQGGAAPIAPMQNPMSQAALIDLLRRSGLGLSAAGQGAPGQGQ